MKSYFSIRMVDNMNKIKPMNVVGVDKVGEAEAGENEEHRAAEVMLRGRGIDCIGAARVVLDILDRVEYCRGKIDSAAQVCRDVVTYGVEEYIHRNNTVSFRELVEKIMRATPHNRPRSRAEFLQYCRRMVRVNPWLVNMPVRQLHVTHCREVIEKSWSTAPTRNKARRILHCLLAFAVRHGWAKENPVERILPLPVQERRIRPLTLAQIGRLLRTLSCDEHRRCAAAVGLMLWAGVRPAEVERLTWQDVDMEKGVVYIAAEHAKTGGARQVTLHAVLLEWLSMMCPVRVPFVSVVPRGWIRRWRDVRIAAGFRNWEPDVLRHTFASYHVLKFRNYEMLQMEMGHSSAALLRTRYIGLDSISRDEATLFWSSVRALMNCDVKGKK